jgi:hypothetical protein
MRMHFYVLVREKKGNCFFLCHLVAKPGNF